MTKITAGTCIQVFAKTPVTGQCKTRLIPALGIDGATALHKAMVQHTLNTATNAGLGPVELWCTPSQQHRFFSDCLKQYPLTLHQQCGHDLGTRMAYAMKYALQKYQQVILIGTDCPTLDENNLRQAQRQLVSGYDAVIGPAQDGGYVLIALRRTDAKIFQSINWGTDTVLQQTRQRLIQLHFHWHELKSHRDIDTPDDLDTLINDNGEIEIGAQRILVNRSD